MSTKTLRKRIALVAVSALGAGLLSVVAVPSASAAVGLAGTVTASASTLYVSSTASTSGEGSANQTLSSASSSGWVSKTSTNGTSSGGGFTLTGGIAGTGVVLAGAKLAVAVSSDDTATAAGTSFVVTGGTLSSVSAIAYDGSVTTTLTPSVNGSSNTAVVLQAGTSRAGMIGRFNISAAAGTTATIAAYSGTGVDDTTTATSGALIGMWTFTVASASASGVYSPTYSSIYTQTAITKGTTAGGAAGTYVGTYDVSSRIDNGKAGVIVYQLADAYGSVVNTGTLAATATNGATVNIVDAGADAVSGVYAATTSFKSQALSSNWYNGYILVNQPAAGVAGSTTVTITHDGAVLATKTLNWNGDIASITYDADNSNNIFADGATEEDDYGWSGILYVAKDAAGNALNLTTLPTLSSGTGALVAASLGTTQNTTSGVLQSAAAGYGTATMIVPTSALNGAGTYKLKLTNSAGVAIYSAVINATVSNGGLNSFAASWDKASYAPGEIAVLTVSGKDVYGNAIADGTAAAGLSLTVAGSATAGFTSVGTACTAATAFYGGKFTCKYAANTEGAWSYSVDVTTATAQSATVGANKITAGGGVSNADVLKAIVSLIASINKQIAALQKALLKK